MILPVNQQETFSLQWFFYTIIESNALWVLRSSACVTHLGAPPDHDFDQDAWMGYLCSTLYQDRRTLSLGWLREYPFLCNGSSFANISASAHSFNHGWPPPSPALLQSKICKYRTTASDYSALLVTPVVCRPFWPCLDRLMLIDFVS
jgi:hypothetical protein